MAGTNRMSGQNKVLVAAKTMTMLVLLVLYIVPFVMVLINSFKPNKVILSNPLSLPNGLFLDNFMKAFEKMNYLTSAANSLVITLAAVFFIVIAASMTAYYFVRLPYKSSNVLFGAMVASMLVPFQVLMIPLVSIYGKFNLLNNKYVLVYMYIGFGASLAVFIYHGFLKSIPLSIEEAAFIDGATRLQTFFQVVLPLMKTTTVTIIILDVLWIWNDYLLPSLVLRTAVNRTLPLTTVYFYGTYGVDFGPLMAALMLIIIPVIILYGFMQKSIIEGVVAGAVKS